ncbi:hypothetical protein CHS0354_021744 [Potamilus streckersoni]|uniref:Uncharacterized protein n=1 Tax=Potamilus streckersoni TaxID=2493646 RepID=A0AAE0WFJ5_9BIVA|nr:hypothetical protein CHS0354_021744 [Potamilus streckersoni]
MRTTVVALFLVWLFLGYSILVQSTRLDSDEDPCLHAKIKDDSRRHIANVQSLPGKLLCDTDLETGWYRFMLNNKSAEIPTVCLRNDLCGTQLPLRIELDGQVLPEMNQTINAFVCSSFSVLGMWDCCVLRQRTRIKNCGGFLVYYLTHSDRCPVSYCVQESGLTPHIDMTAVGGQPVAALDQMDVQNDEPEIQVSVSNVYNTNLTYNTILMREENSTDNYSDVTTTSMKACTNDLKCSANTNDTVWIACKDGHGCGKVCDGFPNCCDDSDETGCPNTEKNMTFSSTRQFSVPLATSTANLASALQDNVTVRDVIHTDTVISSTRMVSQVNVTNAIDALESVTNVLGSFDTLSSIVSSRSLVAQSQQLKGNLSDAIESTSSGEMIQTIGSLWNTTSATLISFIPDTTLDRTVPGQFVSIVSESTAQEFSTVAVTTLLTEMVSPASFVTEGLKDLSEESLSTIHLVTSLVSTSTLATATDFASAISEGTGTSADLQSLPTSAYHLVTGSITVKSTILADKSANCTSITSQPGQLSQPIITTARIPTDDTAVVLTFPVQGRVVNLTDFEERLRKAIAKVLNVYLSGGLNRTKREMDISTLEPSPQRVYKAEDIVVSILENTTERLKVTFQVRDLSDNRSSSSFLSKEELQTMLENPQAWTLLLTENHIYKRHLGLSEQQHASTTIMCSQCPTSQDTLAYEQSIKSIYSSYEHSLMGSFLSETPTMSSRSAHLTTFLTQLSSMNIQHDQYVSLKSVSTAWEHLSRTETESSFEQLYWTPSRVMSIQVDQSSSLYPLPSQYFFSSHSILIDTKPLSNLHLATSVSENGPGNSLISTTSIIPDHTHEVQSTDIYLKPTEQTSVLFSVTPSEPISHIPGSLISSRIPITKSSKSRKSHSSFDMATLLISESLKTAMWLTTQSQYATKSSLGSYQTGDLILSTTSQPYHITSKYPTFKSSTKSASRKSRLHQSSSVIPSKMLKTPDGGIQVTVTSDLEHSATIVTSLHSNATYLMSPEDDDWTVLGIHFGLFIFVVVSGIVVIGTIIFAIIGLILRKQHRSWSPMFDDRISIMKPARIDKHGLESPFPDSDILREEKMMEETEPDLKRNGATPLTTNPECFTSNPCDLDGCIVPIDQLREEELKFPWIEDTKL